MTLVLRMMKKEIILQEHMNKNQYTFFTLVGKQSITNTNRVFIGSLF